MARADFRIKGDKTRRSKADRLAMPLNETPDSFQRLFYFLQ